MKLLLFSASRHSRLECVTASTDNVDFLYPITPENSVCVESFVSHTGRSSMEIFIKIIAENLRTGERKIAATSFQTFVALDDDRKPTQVPAVIAETPEEIALFESAPQRSAERKRKREASKLLAESLTTDYPWK
jgi:acyl-CoA hydrolase